MSNHPTDDGSAAYGFDEIEVDLSIRDGKLSVKSKSGPKSGSVELLVDGSIATLVLTGAGDDRATATLTGPELANFRTILDAALSSLTDANEQPAIDSSVVTSGFQALVDLDGTFGVRFEEETLQALDLIDDDGNLPGGSRQVQCTVLGNGTAILDLTGDDESAFTF